MNFIARDKSMGAKVRVKFFAFNKHGYSKAINSVALKQKYKLFHFGTRAQIVALLRKTQNIGD